MEEKIEEKAKKTSNGVPAAIITAGVIIAIAVLMVGGGFSKKTTEVPAGQNGNTTPTSVPKDIAKLRTNDFVLGDAKKAEIIVYEYSDSDCPFCAQFHQTMKSVVKKYEQKVAFVYRFYPLDSLHPNARTEAHALACVGNLAGNQSFWNYLDKMFTVTLTPSADLGVLTTFAKEESLDVETFEECVKTTQYAKQVESDIKEAQSIGARGTPFSIAVNKAGEQIVIPGALPESEVSKIIDSLLAK